MSKSTLTNAASLQMMGKIRNCSGVEIIPLKRNSNGNNSGNLGKMQRIPYMSDPTLLPRVQKYIEANSDKSFLDINVMADELQQNYREYAKRKKSAFRASVKKAYSIVLQSYGLPDNATSEEEEVSDESAEEEPSFNNSLNNQLMDLYNRPNKIDETELIDISSDEDEEDHGYNNSKSNGPSTSQAPPKTIYEKRMREVMPEKFQQFVGNNDRGKKRKIENNIATPKIVLKKKKVVEEPKFTFKDVGGLDKTLEEVCKLLIHIKHPELYRQIGISPPRGFLLHGPPGCGKTLLANAIAGELGVPLLKVAAPELVAGVSGESEERIRELFERALNSAPCILFIDEIDAITQNRQNAQKEMEKRIVAQMLSCLDDMSQNENGDKVLVIGATNRPDSLDPALRRAGRFDREICLGIPGVEARAQILKVLTAKLKLEEGFDFDNLAKFTPGFVGADLLSLAREAAMAAVNRMIIELKEKRELEKALATSKPEEVKESEPEPKTKPEETDKTEPEIIVDDEPAKEAAPAPSNDPIVVIDDDVKAVEPESKTESQEKEEEPMKVDVIKSNLTPLEEMLSWLHSKVTVTDDQLQGLFITMEDFGKALKCVQPSAKREGFATVPDTTWDDVGSLRSVREELQMAILAPVRHVEQFRQLGLNVPTGILLCGPPGCGKTLLAKAIANEAGINFISVKGPELLNMYVGESERAVRVCFERARNSAPCVIFFDELDALCPKRSDSREGGTTRVVNQMLTEMDGIESREGVFLLAASNRPDIIDPAVLRPGRLDKIIFVGLPTAADRSDILRAITKNGTRPQLAPDVDLEQIGGSEQCQGYTGADLAALVREAGVQALKDYMLQPEPKLLLVTTEHFNRAVMKIRPSVTEKDQKHYESLRKIYTAVPEQNDMEVMEYS